MDNVETSKDKVLLQAVDTMPGKAIIPVLVVGNADDHGEKQAHNCIETQIDDEPEEEPPCPWRGLEYPLALEGNG